MNPSEYSPRLESLSINLMVEDVDKALDYYVDIGFKILQKAPATGPATWAHVEKDGVRFMFQSSTSLKREFSQLESHDKGGALTLWIQVENIAAWYNQVKGKVNIVKELGVTAYNGATEFVIQDPNGFILHFSDLKL